MMERVARGAFTVVKTKKGVDVHPGYMSPGTAIVPPYLHDLPVALRVSLMLSSGAGA
jgi:hypothetical protein